MSPLVIFILILGTLIGYGFAYLRLRGRFILAQEAIQDAEIERHALEWKQNTADKMLASAAQELESVLIRTRRCPDAYSAKQIIGYNYFGDVHPAQYPGGINRWKETH